jgi:hypothetical protein
MTAMSTAPSLEESQSRHGRRPRFAHPTRWLEARVGLPADPSVVRDLRDICGRIAELIDLLAEADIVLEATLHETLTREALGLEPVGQEADDGSE